MSTFILNFSKKRTNLTNMPNCPSTECDSFVKPDTPTIETLMSDEPIVVETMQHQFEQGFENMASSTTTTTTTNITYATTTTASISAPSFTSANTSPTASACMTTSM